MNPLGLADRTAAWASCRAAAANRARDYSPTRRGDALAVLITDYRIAGQAAISRSQTNAAAFGATQRHVGPRGATDSAGISAGGLDDDGRLGLRRPPLEPEHEHRAADDGSTCTARTGGPWLHRAPPRWARRDLGDEPGSSGDTQESRLGLTAGRPLRRMPRRASLGCKPGSRCVTPIEADSARCVRGTLSCGWLGRVYARNETWISAALPDRGCTEGPCFTRSSRSQPAQRAASGGGS